jgi:hypothetical protein
LRIDKSLGAEIFQFLCLGPFRLCRRSCKFLPETIQKRTSSNPLITSIVFKVFHNVAIFEQAAENGRYSGNLNLVSGHYEAVSHHRRGDEASRGLQDVQDCVRERLFIPSLNP